MRHSKRTYNICHWWNVETEKQWAQYWTLRDAISNRDLVWAWVPGLDVLISSLQVRNNPIQSLAVKTVAQLEPFEEDAVVDGVEGCRQIKSD